MLDSRNQLYLIDIDPIRRMGKFRYSPSCVFSRDYVPEFVRIDPVSEKIDTFLYFNCDIFLDRFQLAIIMLDVIIQHSAFDFMELKTGIEVYIEIVSQYQDKMSHWVESNGDYSYLEF